ncbi:MAG: hypothetical protein F9K16_04730 [Thermoanaerobaculia bacterium]|nr:MAG: hypothetical protein F9K16_04730 [Thermoanaerobaculia bacterium]
MSTAALARELECRGRVRLGEIAPASRRRLAGFTGEWLEYSPEEEAIVVRHVQPGGSPALAAVPAELIAMLDLLGADEREESAGGTLVVRERDRLVLRLNVERGEIRIQWPREDWAKARAVEVDAVYRAVDPVSARVSGTARLQARPGAEGDLVSLIESFEGLYPEGDLRVTRDGTWLHVEILGVNVGPEELVRKLRALADPLATLEADLQIGSFAPQSFERDFRLELRGAETRAVRPSLWPES